MNMYNALFGKSPAADVILATLGLTQEMVPRFRDCYVEGDKIVIYTRTGGGNRDYYESEESYRDQNPDDHNPQGPWNADLRKLETYIDDYDDDFDCTYAYFRFGFPAAYKSELEAIGREHPATTPGEKWDGLLESLAESRGKK